MGDVSPKVDVYAFGVVLFELISGKEAVVKENRSTLQPQGLAALVNNCYMLLIIHFSPFLYLVSCSINPSNNTMCLSFISSYLQQFEEVLSESDPNSICKLVDPRLGEDYPLDSVLKVIDPTLTYINEILRPKDEFLYRYLV